MYCRVKASGQVAQIRMQLTNHYIIRYQDGSVERVLKSEVEVLELEDAS